MTIKTLPGRLAAEISRVTELREQYRETGKMIPQANVAPAVSMMSAALAAAIQAAGSPDIQGQIVAVRDLERFTG